MESALCLRSYTLPCTPLRCYTLPRTPLRIPSSLHAANLQFSFRHSSFSHCKGSRSYPARQILGPITCAVGGSRTPSRHNKANDHNMAKRVGRASFTLACVIGIICCSFWSKQKVIAAPEVGKVSSQMLSTAREGVSKKPYSATKANPQCKCQRDRHVPVRKGSESNTNENLQKPISEVPAPIPDVLDKVEDLPQSKLVPDQQASSPPQGGERGSSSTISQESLLSEDEAEEDLKLELQGKTSDVKVPLIVGMVEGLLQSTLVHPQASSPPHGEVQGSSSSVSRESLLSEDKAEKRLKPELQGKTGDVEVPLVVGKVEDLPKSQLVPQQASSTVSEKSLLSEDKAEKHLKPELQGKTSDVKVPLVVGKVEGLPKSQLVPQQASSTVSEKSLLSEDREPEAQEELQGKSNDVKVNSSTSATHFSPSQSLQIDSGVGAVTPFNKGSLASPLVSITFKVDPPTMPSLVFASPSTIMPVEPKLGRSKSDRDDGTKVLVRGVPMSPSIAPMVEQIFAEHGDITANCVVKDQAFRAYLLEGLVTVLQVLQEYPARKLTNDDFTFMYRKLEDLEKVNVNVGWLREQIETLGPFLDVVESRRKWETTVTEVGKMAAKLAEQEAKLAKQEAKLAKQEAKLAQHEGALAQKHTDIAEFETQESKDFRKEDQPVDVGWLHNLGILSHAFGFGSLFYLFFMLK